MGFALSTLRFLVREHMRRPLGPSVCTLGRNRVVATYDQVLAMMRREGWEPRPLRDGQDRETNIPAWRNTPDAIHTSDVVFFQLLGVEKLVTIDVSDYELAEVIWDLNHPLPAGLVGAFDTVIDSGTIEHVHDVHSALRNVNRLTAANGRIIHFTPASNYIDHGYHQLSPIFFIDYYAINGFVGCDAWLAEHVRPFSTLDRWRLYKHQYGVPVAPFAWLWSRNAWGTIIVATKGPSASVDRVPVQGRVALPWTGAEAARGRSRTPRLSALRRKLEPRLKKHPLLWKAAVKTVVWGHYIARGQPIRHPYVGKV